MKKGLSELIFILDMSGSMSSLTEDTIGGFNSMIEKQKEVEGDANITLVLFDHEYIHLYDKLPSNFITKKEATKLGWVSKEGNLWDVAPGKSIGGDYFGNYEGLLPEANDRDYYECDIDYEGGRRNGKRIVYSNDGLIYYTNDHYQSFKEITYEDN